jgi:hypothetical protein
MISKGLKQASKVIIDNNKGCSDRYILTNIHNRLRDKNFKNNIDEIWVYEKGKVRLIYKRKRGIKPLSQAVTANRPAGADP